MLQDYANKVCEIFAGWRIAMADLERLRDIGSGSISIDLLTGATRLNGDDVDPLTISEELAAWLADRAEKDRVPLDELSAATLAVSFRVADDSRGQGNGLRVEFECASELQTDERSYAGQLVKRESWRRSGTSAPWIVYDS